MAQSNVCKKKQINGVDGQTKGGSAKRSEVEGGGKGVTGPRYIPGSEPEQHEKVIQNVFVVLIQIVLMINAML